MLVVSRPADLARMETLFRGEKAPVDGIAALSSTSTGMGGSTTRRSGAEKSSAQRSNTLAIMSWTDRFVNG